MDKLRKLLLIKCIKKSKPGGEWISVGFCVCTMLQLLNFPLVCAAVSLFFQHKIRYFSIKKWSPNKYYKTGNSVNLYIHGVNSTHACWILKILLSVGTFLERSHFRPLIFPIVSSVGLRLKVVCWSNCSEESICIYRGEYQNSVLYNRKGSCYIIWTSTGKRGRVKPRNWDSDIRICSNKTISLVKYCKIENSVRLTLCKLNTDRYQVCHN